VTSVLVDSGKLVSSLFVVRGDRPFTCHVPSLGTAHALFAEFSQTSAGTTWDHLTRLDGTGTAYAVASGVGNMAGVGQFPLTSFARLAVTSGPSAPMSYTVNDLNRA
jgi:hypothetical protein